MQPHRHSPIVSAMAPRVLRPWPRLVSMSRSGRYVAIKAPGGLELVDALGTAPRQTITAPDLVDFACVGANLWLLEGDRIRRITLDGARPIEPPIVLPSAGAGLEPTVGDNAHTALVLGAPAVLANAIYDRVSVESIDAADDALFALIGRRVAAASDDVLRLLEVGRGEVGRASLRDVGPVLGASALFAGRAVAVLCRGENQDVFVVLKPTGALIHKISLPRTRRWAVADNRGVAIVTADDVGVIVVDLRYGRVQSESAAPWPVHDLDVDADGQYVVLAGAAEAGGLPAVLHTPATDLFSVASVARRAAMTAVAHDTEVRHERGGGVPRLQLSLRDDDGPGGATSTAGSAAHGHRLVSVPTHTPVDAADSEAPAIELDEAPPPPVIIPDAAPLAFGVALPPITIEASGEWSPYTSAREHLDEMLDVVAARAARAIAEAWNSGRLSVPSEDIRPFEREVKALLGHVGGYAPELMVESDERLARMTARSGGRTRATLARGIRLPFVELSREFGLSSVAAHVLMVAMAPSARGEIARLFGILGNDENRPIVDRFLIETVIGGGDRAARAEVARELADDAPLLRYGLLRIAANDRAQLFGAITVDPVLIERVRGRLTGGSHGDVTVVRKADRTLDQLHIAATVKRDLVLALAGRRSDEDPVRVVIRGRRGSGRHSLIAALAARVERGIACIDCHRLPRAGKLMAMALRQELFRAVLRGAVPVVSGLEAADPGDAEGQDLIKQTLRAHPGPVVIRAAPEASLPLDPGFVTAVIPSMSESERGVFWAEALARAGLHCGDVDAMAARYRVGPGIIEHVISQVVARRAHESSSVTGEPGPGADDDVAPLLEEVARQHIASRLTHIATHVKRLAKWEQVSLPDDCIDSVREFIARIRHRKTVYEKWGFDSKMTTSRGLTALFYGPPGTGKSMVAGLIARELGLDLYRIDLARIVSKWIGETEKNLAEVFDAAEDGQVVVLFDEADSLFAKRTEVKSSVDRYANLETNYLLQRLDSFEGVAILTTNIEGSIDQAFKRRMSLRLAFPFPDEEMRVRLWAAHIPAETPVSGDFDFVDLARRFPLSGGYIRNSTLRAAFLAAQENRPLSHEHMVRAIALEYRELGKLSSGGRME